MSFQNFSKSCFLRKMNLRMDNKNDDAEQMKKYEEVAKANRALCELMVGVLVEQVQKRQEQKVVHE